MSAAYIDSLKDIISYQRDLITMYQAGEVLRRLEARLPLPRN